SCRSQRPLAPKAGPRPETPCPSPPTRARGAAARRFGRAPRAGPRPSLSLAKAPDPAYAAATPDRGQVSASRGPPFGARPATLSKRKPDMHLLPGILAMAATVVASNILVQVLLGQWLTWGALTYPVAFLITDLINRFFGARAARKVVLAGFATGIF